MPRSLPETDVVIVGMGAAGGVAALPLTNAGLKVVGLEAGGWLNPRDFANKRGHVEPEAMDSSIGWALDAPSVLIGVTIGVFVCVLGLRLAEYEKRQTAELPPPPLPIEEGRAIDFEFYHLLKRNDLYPPQR